MTVNIFTRAQRIIEAGIRSAKDNRAVCQLESIQLYSDYAEPGYRTPESGCIAVGNWNDITQYNREKGRYDTVDDAPRRVARMLEKLGVELEWSDEWTSCEGCGRLFRAVADSYDWQMAGVINDGSCLCNECVDPVEHLESNVNPKRTDMNPYDECLWCVKHCSWCGAAEQFLQLSIPEQVRLVCHVTRFVSSDGRSGQWYCENLEAAVEKHIAWKERMKRS